jgi:hypothetical protein
VTWINFAQLCLGLALGFSLYTRFFWRNLFIIVRWLTVTLFRILQWIFGLLERKFFPEIIKPQEFAANSDTVKPSTPTSKMSKEDVIKWIQENPDQVSATHKVGE